MSGIFDRRAKRFISTEQAERAVPSRTVMASRVARDDVNRSERVQKKENNIQMDKDDFLLTQIDEFREKAKRLQEMLNTKESKAEELSTIVEEREAKAEELQQILDERQEKADGITAQVAKQIDVLIESVHEKMAEIEQSMNAGMDSLGRQVSSDMDNLGRSVNANMDNLGSSMSGQIGNLGQSLGTEISGISQNIGQSLDFGDTLEQTRRITEEGTAAVTSAVNEANAHMLQSLKELNDQLVSIKAELADKVHTENVKCFRNIQDLFKVMGDKVDTVSELEKQVGTTKTFAVISTVLAIINTFGFVAIALYIFGFFGSIF